MYIYLFYYITFNSYQILDVLLLQKVIFFFIKMQDWHPSLSFKKQLNHCLIHIPKLPCVPALQEEKRDAQQKLNMNKTVTYTLLYSSFFSPTANGAKDQLLPFTHREDKQAFS